MVFLNLLEKMYISLSLTEDDFSQTQTAIAKAASELRN